MNKFIAAACVVFGLMSASSATAQNVVLDFETGAVSTSGAYSQSGFTLIPNTFTGTNVLVDLSQNPHNDTLVFAFCAFNGPCGPGTSVSPASDGVFSLLGLDAANFQREAFVGSLDLVGLFQGGGTVAQTLSLGNTWLTFDLTGFDNLTSLTITGRNVFAVDIDNVRLALGSLAPPPEPGTGGVVVDPGTATGGAGVIALPPPADVGAVPEPASWAMMLLGFGAIGLSLRRKGAKLRPQRA